MISLRRILLAQTILGLVVSPLNVYAVPAVKYDAELCALAQRMIVNAPEDAFEIEVLVGESNGFHVIQMDVDATTNTVMIATTTGMVETENGHLSAYVAARWLIVSVSMMSWALA